jgi:hypothetical protein
MNYLLISDILWYSGHIMSDISIFFTKGHFYVAVSLILFGQFITIISRPIGRIKSESKISCIEKDCEIMNNNNE